MSRRAPFEGEAEIIDLSHDGRGVARTDGKVVFIADALPQETVRYRRTRRKRQADEGQMLEVLSASPDRIAPGCEHFGVCGGCALQHLDNDRQLAFKQRQLTEALQRIGNVRAGTVAEPVRGPVWGYRRKARLAARYVAKKGRLVLGFRERHAPYVADIRQCEVLDPRVGKRLPALAAVLNELSIRERIPQVEVACADTVALVLRILDPLTSADRDRLQAFAEETGFAILLQPAGPDSVTPLGTAGAPLSYSPDGSDLELGFEPLDFVQVNHDVSQQMVRQAMDWLRPQPGERVLELFSGLGNFSLPLAAAGAAATAVEGDAGLVERARANAQANGLTIEHHVADLFAVDGSEAWLRVDYDAVLLDPPRSGAKEILPHLAARQPQRILYVSCHPGSLARDAGTLVNEHGYRCTRAGVMDMFPHTAHVESMALFERGDG